MLLEADGVLKSGQLLPSERRLTDKLGVSRTALREGLRLLRARGIIHTQQGRGSYVSQIAQVDAEPLVHLFQSQPRTLYDLLEVRALLEGESARLAALRGTEIDFIMIRRRYEAMLAEHGQGALPSESGTVRGLARLLRRNPTDAERILWQALTRDRRFAGQFKRQTPVGRHIPDFVSFVHRIAVELINPDETEVIAKDRAGRRAWLEARDYRVIEMKVADVEHDLAAADALGIDDRAHRGHDRIHVDAEPTENFLRHFSQPSVRPCGRLRPAKARPCNRHACGATL